MKGETRDASEFEYLAYHPTDSTKKKAFKIVEIEVFKVNFID